MQLPDIFSILSWWFLFFITGLFFFPLTSRLFPILTDKGYPFAKVIGMIIISYLIFILDMTFFSFIRLSSIIFAGIISFGFCFYFIREKQKNRTQYNFSIFTSIGKIILIEEFIFFVALFSWSYVRSFQPDIYGLEKYMDFGFVNSILRTQHFPPKDMWFTPFSINYYYFGHLFTAVFTQLSGIPSKITYNLMIATLFAFCFSLSYSLVSNLISIVQKQSNSKKITKKNIVFRFLLSIITAGFVSLGGNLHTLYMFFLPYNTDHPVPFTSLQLALQTTPNSYWYPNATRFIYNTIHEFPLYSFVVSDLHGHVLSIPIVLTIICTLAVLYIRKKIYILHLLFIAFLLAVAYMTNAWDGAIYLLLTVSVIVTVQIQQIWQEKRRKNVFSFIKHDVLTSGTFINILYYSMIVIAAFFLFSLPFSLHFKPFVGGVGILCAPTILTNLQKVGPFLFEAEHCQKSPLWQLAILHGFYSFFAVAFLIFLTRTKKILDIDIYAILLVLLGGMLIIIPEFIYLKDIYPAHYRANTMFKLVYQSFMMLSLLIGYIFFRITMIFWKVKSLFGKTTISMFMIITFISSCLILYYPVMAIRSYYNDLHSIKGLDGTAYLKTLHPDDYAAIQWINENIFGQPVIVEAQGDSYTDYERISANTGLPTILGWTVHEWLWRGTYDIPAPRISEVQTLYETTRISELHDIIKQYHITYIYVGDLERQKYPKLSEAKFKKIGKVIYHHGNTRIYKITGS